MKDVCDTLVEDARRGDRRALEVLLERQLPGLRAFVRLRTGRALRDRESSSDLVQSVCREVLQDLDEFEYRGEAAFRQWLCEAALRKIVDRDRYWRAAKREAAREVRAPSVPSRDDSPLLASYASFSTPSQNAIVHEEAERIEAAFDRLPEDYREVITLARIVGLSHEEIARKMGRTEDSVRNLLSRALARLGGLLATKDSGQRRAPSS